MWHGSIGWKKAFFIEHTFSDFNPYINRDIIILSIQNNIYVWCNSWNWKVVYGYLIVALNEYENIQS